MNPLPVPPPSSATTPPTQALPQAIIAPPTSHWQALRQVGWWKGIDSVVLALVLAHVVTGFFFLVFGRLTFNIVTVGALQCIALLLAWTVILVYRCMSFVLALRAGIEMLPFDAARIAVGFLQSGTPLENPAKR